MAAGIAPAHQFGLRVIKFAVGTGTLAEERFGLRVLPGRHPRHRIIADAEAELSGSGRLVIRPSGTEPVIRVMAEGDDATQVESVVDRICDAVKAAAA